MASDTGVNPYRAGEVERLHQEKDRLHKRLHKITKRVEKRLQKIDKQISVLCLECTHKQPNGRSAVGGFMIAFCSICGESFD